MIMPHFFAIMTLLLHNDENYMIFFNIILNHNLFIYNLNNKNTIYM